MLVYAAIGAVGLLFLLVMLFVGDLFGDHDVDHPDLDHDGGPSFLSMRVMEESPHEGPAPPSGTGCRGRLEQRRTAAGAR